MRQPARNPLVAALIAILIAAPGGTIAQPLAGAPNSSETDGTVVVPSFRLPPSIYMSEEAKAKLPRTASDPNDMLVRLVAAGKAGEYRQKMAQFMAPQLKHVVELYPATTQATTIAGIPAVIATPANGIPAANRDKILLDLPGGGFVMGAADGTGMVESIPVAALARVKVVSITYRQAPEAAFPAASEDVAAVYRELLKTHRARDIGIFGCSAGGLLAAEAMAWFEKERLPLPGALGIFCASADARRGGDSIAWERAMMGLVPRPDGPRPYFNDRDLTDPLASPILSPAILARFPPTLIISATRAKELSAAVDTHRELVKAGVTAALNIWDGLGHAFFYDVDLPESREAFQVMARFFCDTLDLSPGKGS